MLSTMTKLSDLYSPNNSSSLPSKKIRGARETGLFELNPLFRLWMSVQVHYSNSLSAIHESEALESLISSDDTSVTGRDVDSQKQTSQKRLLACPPNKSFSLSSRAGPIEDHQVLKLFLPAPFLSQTSPVLPCLPIFIPISFGHTFQGLNKLIPTILHSRRELELNPGPLAPPAATLTARLWLNKLCYFKSGLHPLQTAASIFKYGLHVPKIHKRQLIHYTTITCLMFTRT